MNLLDKYNLKWEDRFKIIPFKIRVKINSDFFEKFKERGDNEILFKDHPRLIDENGNKTEKLVILGDTRDGHVIESGEDEKGRYHIFQAKKSDLKKIKGMAIAKDKMVKLSFLNKLQIDLVKPGIELNEIESIEKEIDTLFVDIFDLESKPNKVENPHPSIFADGVFEVFEKWIETTKEMPQKSLSFIFQQLKTENNLRLTNFKDLLNWSNDNGYIDKVNFDRMMLEGCFVSPSKILSKGRKSQYQTMLDNHFPNFGNNLL